MKLLKHLLISTAASGFILACEGTDSLSEVSEVEENATYAAAVTQGGDPLENIGTDAAALEDETNTDESLHRDCSLSGVHGRLLERYDADQDGVLNDEERAALEADFEAQGPGEGRGPPGEGRGPPGEGRGPPGEGRGPPGEGRGPPEEGLGPMGAEGPRSGHGHGPMPFRRLMKIYDADQNGELDEAERALLQADLEARGVALEARMLAEFDADLDGALSDSELEAAREARRAAREARRAEELAANDTDGDGSLSHEERRAAHEARRAAMEARFDANGDGTLDSAELAALREFLRSVVRGEVEPE